MLLTILLVLFKHKGSQTTVRNRTQIRPVILRVEIFAVNIMVFHVVGEAVAKTSFY